MVLSVESDESAVAAERQHTVEGGGKESSCTFDVALHGRRGKRSAIQVGLPSQSSRSPPLAALRAPAPPVKGLCRERGEAEQRAA